jgi:glucose/arabinose dehydrogenase
MHNKRLQAATLLLVIGACSAAPSNQADASAGTAESASQAAPSGQPFAVTPVAQFSTPWAMSFLPGSGVRLTNMALVSEKDGRLWLVDAANGRKQAVSGVPQAKVAGQGGLGDVVPGPSFAGDRRVYLSYVEAGAGGTSGAVVGYGTLEMGQGNPRLANFKVIWRQSPKVTGNGHFSHRILFSPDGGHMFLTSGDRQKFDPAQELSGNLGKVLRLTPEGRPVPGNPWASRGEVARQFWSIGHRNLLGIAFSPDGQLWASEMGPKGGDEINLIEPGKNYGWPVVSNGDHYDGRAIPDHPTRPELEAPDVWWDPVISPGGMIVYSGDLFPEWKGDILQSALSGEALIRVDVNGAKAKKAEQWGMGARIREVEQGPGGEVYLLEDAGRLLRLTPAGR